MPENDEKKTNKIKEMSDREILEMLAVESRKQAAWRRVNIVLWAMLVICIIVFASVYIPKINEVLDVYHSTMNNINSTLEDVEDMKVNIENTVAELKTNIDGLTEKADVLLTDLQAQVDGLENIERRLNPLNW